MRIPVVHTPAERDILHTMALEGHSSRAIADKLGWSNPLRVANSPIARRGWAEHKRASAGKLANKLTPVASGIERVTYAVAAGPDQILHISLARIPGWSEGSDRVREVRG